jgi:hypothetical protein
MIFSKEDGGEISEELMDKLLDSIIDVLEAEGFGLGGGFHPCEACTEDACGFGLN